MIQRCFQCRATYPLEQVIYDCTACGSVLEIELDDALLKTALAAQPSPQAFPAPASLKGEGVWRYAALLPVDARRAVSMGEGATHLHRCDRLAQRFGLDELYVKNEGENPTGSFKDRGMTVGVSRAVEAGFSAVACASTGNTSASMAAYAAKAGLTAIVLVPGGKVALGKVAQAVVHGARIVQIDGDFDVAMRAVRALSSSRGGVYLLNSINPFRLEGQKTLAFEVCESLGGPPNTVILPMGNAGNISAIWKGFREFQRGGRIDRLPRMIGVQAAGAAPLVQTIASKSDTCVVARPETVATAIRIGAPVNWHKAVAAVEQSGGAALAVSDEQILAAQRLLAQTEGLFVEPASAVSIAYLETQRPKGLGRVVCVTTGHGLKDPDVILRDAPPFLQAEPTADSLARTLGL